MYCVNCGSELDEMDYLIERCGNCGYGLNGDDE